MNASVELDKGDVRFFAEQAKEVGEALESASKRIAGPAESIELSGWASEKALTAVAATWKTKTEALTQGESGLFEFGAALKQFVLEVDVLDSDNADTIDSAHEANAEIATLDDAFEGGYKPKAAA